MTGGRRWYVMLRGAHIPGEHEAGDSKGSSRQDASAGGGQRVHNNSLRESRVSFKGMYISSEKQRKL